MRTTAPRIYTEKPGGGGRVWLDAIGSTLTPAAVTGLKWRTSYPGGGTSWEADLSFDPGASHQGLEIGRDTYIVSGGAVRFRGTLTVAQRGQPWHLQGTGLASLVVSRTGKGGFVAVDSGGNAYNLDNIVTQAIGRGLPYTISGTLGTAGSAPSGSCDIDTALATVGKALGKAWTLTPAGAIAMSALPTSPIYVLAARQALTPQLVGYAQAVGVYQSSSTATATITVANSAAQTKWGHLEGLYDMTSLGVITSGTATTYATNWLNANLPYPTYANQLTVQPGQLRALSGTSLGGPVDLATVRAGCLITVTDVDPSHSHLLTPGPLQILVGETEYDADADTLTLTPVGALGTNLKSALYQSMGGAL